MTTIISEKDLRKYQSLVNPYLFKMVQQTDRSYYPSYNSNKTNPLKILSPDDTFHDLAKDRTGYNSVTFTQGGIANYLMTGQFIGSDFMNFYKSELNYDEYGMSSGTFENKVANSFEIKHALEPASVTITYDDIVYGFLIPNENTSTINQGNFIFNDLKQKIVLSNGSINIKPDLVENMSFEKYTSKFGDNENEKNIAMLKISHFIKWYLHSTDLIDFNSIIQTNFQITIPPSINMLFDAGMFHMSEVFGVEGSGGTPYISGASLLDSASTSSNLLDPSRPIDYENMPVSTDGGGLIIPILSNYFSCENIFMCYLSNNGKFFGKDGMYCFSLVIIKIPTEQNQYADDNNLKPAIDSIRNEQLGSENYNTAIQFVTYYINAYPSKVVRYYFGEVEKDINNDNSSCGTCGAGVPYLGKVFSIITTELNATQQVSGDWNSPTLAGIKERFNRLKTTEKLNSRIPIADARILKLFSNNTGFVNITNEDIALLYQILADYKRTGDYQQVYSVLKVILDSGQTNINNYTFSSGDELAALLSRLCGLPTILQTAAIGKTILYRSNYFMANEAQREQVVIQSHKNIIKSFVQEIPLKFNTIFSFLNSHYENICNLRNSIITNIGRIQFDIDKLLLLNALYILSKLIDLSNNLNKVDPLTVDGNIYNTIGDQLSLVGSYVSQIDRLNISLLKTLTSLISKISENKIFSLIEYIDENFPSLSLVNNSQGANIFEPLNPTEIQTLSFIRPSLNLFFKNGQSKDKVLNKFRKYTTVVQPSRSSRTSPVVGQYDSEETKTKIVKNFNSFVSTLQPFDLTSKYDVSEISIIPPKIVELSQEYQFYLEKYVSSSQCNLEQISYNINFIRSIFPNNTTISGGSIDYYSIIQKGGMTIQQQNIYSIYTSIKKILLVLLNKCNNYMIDVTNKIGPVSSLVDSFDKIRIKYDVKQFCIDLLYSTSDDIDDNNDNDGVITSLTELASNFTHEDLNANSSTPDSIVTLQDLFIGFGLRQVQIILFMLSVFTNDDGSQDLTITSDVCNDIGLDPNSLPQFIKDIYRISTPTPYPVTFSQVFTVSIFALLDYFYNGINSSSFYQVNISQPIFGEFINNFGLSRYGLSRFTPEMFLTGKNNTSFGDLTNLLDATVIKVASLCSIPYTPQAITISQTTNSRSYSQVQSQNSNPYAKTYTSYRRGGKMKKTRKLKRIKRIKRIKTIKVNKKQKVKKTMKKRKGKTYKSTLLKV